jgi:hypothetical protein
MRTLFNVVGTQIGWFACALGAAHDKPWIGILVVLLYLSVHLYWSQDRQREAVLILTVGILGMLVDSLCRITGLLTYNGDLLAFTWLAPLWIVALWLQFASMLNASLAWLQGRYVLAFVMGAVFGPLSYLGGARLGALALNHEKGFTVLVLGLIWGMVMPFLAWLARRTLHEGRPA